MKVTWFIAWRYLFAKKKTNFSNIITLISIVALSVGTASLIVALSVFNGMEDLLRTIHSSFDPELKIIPEKGKVFELEPDIVGKLTTIEGVEHVSEVIEDDALLEYKNESLIVKLKGVSENYSEQSRVDSMIIAGDFALEFQGKPAMVMGVGVADKLGVALQDYFVPMRLMYPKRKIAFRSLSNPEKNLNIATIIPAGIFAIEKRVDDQYVFVPLNIAKGLLKYTNERSHLEIKLKEGADLKNVKSAISSVMGSGMRVLDQDEQHVSLLRAVKIEKLFIGIVLCVILLILSFNFYCSLRLLVIEKKKDISVLYALGASKGFIKKLFITEGLLMALVSAGAGLLIGLGVCLAQQEFGLVAMGMETSLVENYPVKMVPGDFVFSFLALMTISGLAMYRPAVKASQTNITANI